VPIFQPFWLIWIRVPVLGRLLFRQILVSKAGGSRTKVGWE